MTDPKLALDFKQGPEDSDLLKHMAVPAEESVALQKLAQIKHVSISALFSNQIARLLVQRPSSLLAFP